SEPGDASPFSTRTFVGDLKRYLYILDLNAKQFTTYINFEDVFPKFVNGTSYGTGFATFAFDPDYERNGRFYTVHTEGPNLPGSATPSNANLAGLDLSAGYATTASIDPPVGTVARHAVLVEWTDTDLSTSVFEGTAREVLRVGFTHGNHSIADMTFSPVAQPGDSDYGNLYIALGDGGAGQDDDAGHSIPQRLDAMPGKVLRVTPDISLRPGDLLAANGRYRIPATGADPNPFVTLEDPAVKKEIFAYGFRNPQRMSWDPITNSLIVADIGLYAWEELNIIRKGANYGYAEREGSEQLFVGGLNDGRTGSQTTPPTAFPSPDTLDVAGIAAPVVPTYPVAGYSHRDGDAIAGGFVYRGTRMPQLYGKYIFGDVSTARVFYVDVEDMIAADDGDPSTLAPITELNVVFDSPNDSPDLGAVAMRLFDVIANQYAYRGGSTGDGAALPEAGGHMSDDVDNAGMPFGGGRADIRFSVDRNGELYILSKSDGMIRAVVGARGGGTRTVLTTTPNPSSSDAPLELNARVTAYRDVPVGSVEFYDGGLSLGTAVVSAGIATLTTSELAPGLHLLKARFAPSGPEFLGSASGLSHFVSAPATYPIDVTLAGSGGGTVSSSPAGIACPTTCIASFRNGEAVTLAAAPNTTSMFVGWSGACTGTGSCTVTVDTAASVTATFAPGQADLASVLGSTPSIATPGGLLALTETTVNDGSAMAATSATRYYLSLDTFKGAGDVTLGSRAISTLAAGASSQGNPSFTIPATTVVGSYRVLACADDTAKVLESDEDNNCAASTTAVSLTRPDLVLSAVSSPGGYLAPGGTFTVSDTVINQGGYSSGVSTTRYYLSIDATKSAGDLMLTGTRSVPALTSSGASAENATVTIPASTALATYYVVACADDLKKVIELQEGNNCRASGTQLAVSRPDLFTSAVSNPPSQTAPGRSFSLTDTVLNQGQVGATASSTRYYLSADAVKDAGDI
ncbi:MAG: PQQ-dependent sugar dehydrogenase, partial [Gemmatimonadaceae bacterium]|nr:PQQ-dependent sugar dehydrogenase [Gemmatimonadaceae bacterium]